MCWLKDRHKHNVGHASDISEVHNKVFNFKAKTYFPSMHIIFNACAVLIAIKGAQKCAQKQKVPICLLGLPSMYAARPCNPIPFPWNLLEMLGLLLKCTNIYWYFQRFANKSPTFTTMPIRTSLLDFLLFDMVPVISYIIFFNYFDFALRIFDICDFYISG